MSVDETGLVALRKRAREYRGDRESACRFAVAIVGAGLEVDPRLLVAAGRGCARVAAARGVAMYLAHVKLGMTLTEVGRQFGRDRTTVSDACVRIEDARDDARFDALLTRLEGVLDGWRKAFLEPQR